MDIRVTLLLSLEALLALFLLYRDGLFQTRRAQIVSVLLVLLAFSLRALAFDYETLDYQNFLTRWVRFFRDNGGFAALDRSVGNYNIPYLYFLALFSYSSIRDLYLIKLLSTLFDVLLAWSAMLLIRRFRQSPPLLIGCFFTVLFLPTVFLNSAVWAQCDSTYVALALLAITLAMEDRPIPAMLCITLSFGFKLQAVFVMPIFAVFWMQGKLNWKHLLLFPVFYILLVLPAVCMGRPFLETITLYFQQTGSIGSGLNYNSSSIFAIFTQIQDPQPASTIAIVAAAVLVLNLLALAWAKRDRLNDQAILGLTLLFAIGIPFLLPHMHDRYFYAADILTVVLAFAAPFFSPAALFTQFASLLGYHAYLKMQYLLPMRFGAAALILSLALSLIYLLMGLQVPPPKNERMRQPNRPKNRS
ncbi:MAG: DUF2029 domain-containing protein [Oscillospiraceae bacterium]|nr:DUF2029 domain-containing protein [Oscillospiraceae bacterium]